MFCFIFIVMFSSRVSVPCFVQLQWPVSSLKRAFSREFWVLQMFLKPTEVPVGVGQSSVQHGAKLPQHPIPVVSRL